jgi:hypothetical protein
MGVEDVPLAEDEASGDLADLALGGGDPEPSVGVGSVEGVPGGVRLPAGPHWTPGLRELPSEPSAARQRSDGGGVQDGVQPTSETFGDGVECGGRSANRRPSGDRPERSVVGSASIVLAIEETSRRANSAGFGEEIPEKSRIILGVGAIPPDKIKIKGDLEQKLIKVACSDPPQGRCHWTLQLLADELVVLGLVDAVSTETVRKALKKTTSSPGSLRPGASRPRPMPSTSGAWKT